jgi:hypothetical protein
MLPEDCDKWKADPSKNPLTGRKISADGPVYKKISKECLGEPSKPPDRPISKEDCEAWKKDPSHHPITKRKLRMGAKTGIYTQLAKLCNMSVKKLSTGRKSAPVVKDDLEEQRLKLIEAMKRVVGPLLNKSDSTKARIQFANIIRNYLSELKPCLEQKDKKLWLYTKDKQPVVYFDKQIGSQSAYGVAYMNMGHGFAKLLRFSCKLMSSKIRGHKLEIELLEKMSKFVETGQSPNMPITYMSMKCTKKCTINECPSNTKEGGYYVVINELANSDIQNWFRESYSPEVYESVIMQLVFAIYAFHNMGYIHNDCHLGNFLIHEVTPGGCWRYKVDNTNVYVPNTGYLLVMWDPGLAKVKFATDDQRVDYSRALGLITNMMNYKKYRDLGMKPIPDETLTYGIVPIYNTIMFEDNSEKKIILKILDRIKSNMIKLPSIKVDGTPPSHLLNVTPFRMGR